MDRFTRASLAPGDGDEQGGFCGEKDITRLRVGAVGDLALREPEKPVAVDLRRDVRNRIVDRGRRGRSEIVEHQIVRYLQGGAAVDPALLAESDDDRVLRNLGPCSIVLLSIRALPPFGRSML